MVLDLLRSSLRDLKNGLPPSALADRFHRRGIVFVHVPKCAGTSVEKALRQHYRISRMAIDPEASFAGAEKLTGLSSSIDTQHALLMRASELRRDMLHYYLAHNYKCITGHAPLGSDTAAVASNTHDFVTILRDPIERFISHLNFNSDPRSGHGYANQPLESFLESPRAQVMSNLYGKYFSGMPMTADFSSDKAVEAAKKSLTRFSVVGIVSSMDRFSTDISRLTGKSIHIGHENRFHADESNYSTAIMEKIVSLCAADQEIYNWARMQFG